MSAIWRNGIGRVGWGLSVALSLQLLACDRQDPARPTSVANAAAPASMPLVVTIEPGTPTVETGLVAAPNEEAVAYQWMRNGTVLEGERTRTLGKGLFVKDDEITVTVTLDERAASATAHIGNSPPKVLAVKLDPAPHNMRRGVTLTALPEGVDPDGDEIRWSYQWIINDRESPSDTEASLPGDRYRRGDRVSVRVTPSDASRQGAPFIPLPIAVPNTSPEFKSQPSPVFQSATYHYEVRAEDADGDEVRYALAGAPEGMTIDPITGRITWSLVGRAAGLHAVEVVAQDGAGGRTSQVFTLTLRPPGGT